MKSEVTILRLRYLQAVEEICRTQPFGLATPIEVETKMGLRDRVSKSMLLRLFKVGWLERPYRGCYHLSEKGKKILKEAER